MRKHVAWESRGFFGESYIGNNFLKVVECFKSCLEVQDILEIWIRFWSSSENSNFHSSKFTTAIISYMGFGTLHRPMSVSYFGFLTLCKLVIRLPSSVQFSRLQCSSKKLADIRVCKMSFQPSCLKMLSLPQCSSLKAGVQHSVVATFWLSRM